MATAGNLNVMRDLLECPICMVEFQYPKLLNCGHTFCKTCIEQTTAPDARVITCPTCRGKTRKPEIGFEGLPHDFRVGQLRDGLGAMTVDATSPKSPGHGCGICRTRTSEVCCLDCHKYMCATCLRNHNVREMVAMHTVIKVPDLQTCEDHGENCSHVCVDCKSLVCITCTQDICADHEVRNIGDAARRHAGTGNTKARIQRSKNEYNKMKSNQVEQFRLVEQEIRRTTATLCRQLTEQEAIMLRDLQVMKENAMSELEARRLQEEEKLLKIEEARVTSQALLQNGIPNSLLNALPVLESLAYQKADKNGLKFTPAETVTIGELKNTAVEIKKVFRFEKVVLVKRDHITTLLGKHGDIIVRNDFNGADSNNVKLYHKGVDREYDMDAEQIARLPIIFGQNWKPYLPNIRQMTYKIKNYAQTNNIQLNNMVVKQSSRDKSVGRTARGGRNSRSRRNSSQSHQ